VAVTSIGRIGLTGRRGSPLCIHDRSGLVGAIRAQLTAVPSKFQAAVGDEPYPRR